MKENISIREFLDEVHTGCYVSSNAVYYYLNDQLHREDGPAYIHNSGIYSYWYYGHLASNRGEFLDFYWRRKIEIKVFL